MGLRGLLGQEGGIHDGLHCSGREQGTDPQGRTLKERLPSDLASRQWGENIWTGRGYDPRQVRYLAEKIMDGWMKSAAHRANILTPGYTHLGVGVMAKNQDIKATQVFIGMGGAGTPTPAFQRK